MKKNKSGKIIKIISINLIIIISVLVTCSYFLPNSKYGYRNLFIDSKTHTYESGESFDYGVYRFKFTASIREHNSPMKDCSLENASRTTATCDAVNKNNAKLNSTSDILDLGFRVENLSDKIQSLPNNWYKLQSAKGAEFEFISFKYDPGVYGGDDSFNFITTSILPHAVRERSINSELIERDDHPTLIITLPGLAPQIVNIREN